jgi:hypothetical protein
MGAYIAITNGLYCIRRQVWWFFHPGFRFSPSFSCSLFPSLLLVADERVDDRVDDTFGDRIDDRSDGRNNDRRGNRLRSRIVP